MALLNNDYCIVDMLYFRHGILDIIIGLSLLDILSYYHNTSEQLFGENLELRRYFGYFTLCLGFLRLVSTYNKQYEWISFTYVFESLILLHETFILGTINGNFIVLCAIAVNLSIAYFTFNKMK
jgi:hypothetical protein